MRIGSVSNAQELEGEEDYDAIHADDLSCDFAFARCGDRIGEASANFIGMRDGEGFQYFDVDELNTIRVYHGKGDSDLVPLPIELWIQGAFVRNEPVYDVNTFKCTAPNGEFWTPADFMQAIATVEQRTRFIAPGRIGQSMLNFRFYEGFSRRTLTDGNTVYKAEFGN